MWRVSIISANIEENKRSVERPWQQDWFLAKYGPMRNEDKTSETEILAENIDKMESRGIFGVWLWTDIGCNRYQHVLKLGNLNESPR